MSSLPVPLPAPAPGSASAAGVAMGVRHPQTPALPPERFKSGHVPSESKQRKIDDVVFNLRLKQPARDYLKCCIAAPNAPEDLLSKRCIQFIDRRLGVQLLISHWLAPFATIISNDPRTVFIFAFPPPVSLTFRGPSGQAATKTRYAPQFLVVRDTQVVAIRVKRHAELLVALERRPEHFYRDDQGRIHCKPAEQAFAEMGLDLELIDESGFSRELAENIQFLERYRRPACPALEPEIAQRLVEAIKRNRLAAFHQLLRDGFSADQIFKAVADDLVYVNQAKDLLDLSASLILYESEAAYQALHEVAVEFLQPPPPYPGFRMQPGTKFECDGKSFVVVLPGDRDVMVRDAKGDFTVKTLSDMKALKDAGLLRVTEQPDTGIATALSDCTDAEIARAISARKELKAWKAGLPTTMAVSTLRRWQRKVQSARNSAEVLLLLVDDFAKRGNRSQRLTNCQERVLKKAISVFYNQPHKPTAKWAHGQYEKLCGRVKDKLLGTPVSHVSYPTFWTRCKLPESNTRRQSKSEKYQSSPSVPSTDSTLTYHGVRPHEVCYVDHTTLPIVPIAPNLSVTLTKPTLTLAYDAAVKRARAMVVLYQAPSIFIVMMLLRDYVRRHGCLPRKLSFDHGSDLLSDDVREFCRLYEIDAVFRKPGEPRNGAPIESQFAAVMEEIIKNLKGNTVAFRTDVRLVDKATDPFRNDTPEWTLTALHGALDWYFFVYHPETVEDPDLKMTSAKFEALRYLETGSKDMIDVVELDQNFLLATSPHPRKKWYHVIDPQRGVYESGKWHWNDCFAMTGGQMAEIRLEIWLDRLIYCRVEGYGWVAALSKSYLRAPLETSHEAGLYERCTRSIATLRARQSRTLPQTLKRLADAYNPEKFDVRLRTQSDESIYLYRSIGLTTLPVPLSDAQQKALALPFIGLELGRSIDPVVPGSAANDETSVVHSAGDVGAKHDGAPDQANPVDEEDDDDDEDDNHHLKLADFF